MAVAFVLVVMLVLPAGRRERNISHRPPAVAPSSPAVTVGVSYQPPRVVPAQSPEQSRIDSELSHAEQTPSLPSGGLASLPAPGYSAAYPPIRAADRNNAFSFGTAFVTELLDRDYAHQSQSALLAWAQEESAPDTLPGVQADLAGQSLVLSLLDPAPPPGPVPSARDWTTLANSGDVASVDNITAATNPEWLSLTATGWQPADPAMTILTISGNLTSRGAPVETFSLVLTLGSSGSRLGYGAVAVDDWTVM